MHSSIVLFLTILFSQIVVYECTGTCPILQHPSNGWVGYNGPKVGERYPINTVAHIFCNSGYIRNGHSSRTCLSSGNWNRQTPTCNLVTTTAAPSGGGGCFPATSKVNLIDGKSLSMSELQVGDKVQTVSSTGTITYSEVQTFLKKQPSRITEYKSITTNGNEIITLTENHLLYGRKGFAEQVSLIYADQLTIGDEVLVDKNGQLAPVEVINITSHMMQGLYVPLTLEGRIVVNGVVASCYADFHHDLAHWIMTPMQRFSEAMMWIFGDDTGFPVYVKTSRALGMLMLPVEYFWRN